MTSKTVKSIYEAELILAKSAIESLDMRIKRMKKELVDAETLQREVNALVIELSNLLNAKAAPRDSAVVSSIRAKPRTKGVICGT